MGQKPCSNHINCVCVCVCDFLGGGGLMLVIVTPGKRILKTNADQSTGAFGRCISGVFVGVV